MPTDEMPADRTPIKAVLAAVRDDLPALTNRIVDAIQRKVPFYGVEGMVETDYLRQSTSDNIDLLLAGLEGGKADLRAATATARVRAAQGGPLVELLTAYRLGVQEMWATALDVARSLPEVPAEAMVDLSGLVMVIQNDYVDAVIEAYRDEAQQVLRARERERAVLVDVILADSAASGTLWEVAMALRLPLDGAFVVVAVGTELGHDPLPRVESALAAIGIRSVWRLQADLLVGVVSMSDPSRVDAMLSVLHRHAETAVGVSPVFADLKQASRGLDLARTALARHAREAVVVDQFVDSPINMLVAAAPQAAMATSREILGDLLKLSDDDRDLLLTTFEAWLEADGSANGAGAIVFCHPNTIRYRLRRIETLTGRTLSHPRDVAELVTATRAWSELPQSPTA